MIDNDAVFPAQTKKQRIGAGIAIALLLLTGQALRPLPHIHYYQFPAT
jgi:hypothetical protein